MVRAALDASPLPPSEQPADWGELDDAFLTIWTRPRETIRRIVAVDPKHWVWALASLGGGSSVLSNASSGNFGDRMSLGSILLMAVIGGPIAGIIVLYLFGWLVRLTGEWFLHGRARPEAVRAALAWGEVPFAAMLPLLLLASVLLPGAFRSDLGAAGPVGQLFAGIVGLVTGTMAVWGTVISAHTTAEVQGYRSAWKGLWNMILPGLLLAGLVVVVALIVGILGGLAGLAG